MKTCSRTANRRPFRSVNAHTIKKPLRKANNRKSSVSQLFRSTHPTWRYVETIISHPDEVSIPPNKKKNTKKKQSDPAIAVESPSVSKATPVAQMPPLFPAQFEMISRIRKTKGPFVDYDTKAIDYSTTAVVKTKRPKKTTPNQRFHSLIGLMLSAMTKAKVESEAMYLLDHTLPGGLTIQSLIDADEAVVHDCIKKVTFHNTKLKNIIKVAHILHEEYNNDIPRTAQEMLALPGVGPKMTHLCMADAWGEVTGIGVDVHVHRLCNMLHWVDTNTPEQTRIALESWLPREQWTNVNHQLVRFGQTLCPSRGKKCQICPLAYAEICPSSKLQRITPNDGHIDGELIDPTKKSKKVDESTLLAIEKAKEIAFDVDKRLVEPLRQQGHDIQSYIHGGHLPPKKSQKQ